MGKLVSLVCDLCGESIKVEESKKARLELYVGKRLRKFELMLHEDCASKITESADIYKPDGRGRRGRPKGSKNKVIEGAGNLEVAQHDPRKDDE